MIVQSYNMSVIDCAEVLKTLDILRPIIDDCCSHCTKLDPKRYSKHERWKYGISLDYWRHNHIHKLKPYSDKRDYLFPMEIVSCCQHIHVIRNLSQSEWKRLKTEIHDPCYVGMISNKKSKKTRKKVRLDTCDFCDRELVSGEVTCSVCFP